MARNNTFNRTGGRGLSLPALGVGPARNGDGSAAMGSSATGAASLSVSPRGQANAKLPSAAGAQPRPTASRSPRKSISNSSLGMPAIDENNGSRHTGGSVKSGRGNSTRKQNAAPQGDSHSLPRQKTLPSLTGNSMTGVHAIRDSHRKVPSSSNLQNGSSQSGFLPMLSSSHQAVHQPSEAHTIASRAASTQNSLTAAAAAAATDSASLWRHSSVGDSQNQMGGVRGRSYQSGVLPQAVADTEMVPDRMRNLQGKFDCAGWSEIGAKQENQDVFDIQQIGADGLYVSVLDGHGPDGGEAAKKGTSHLHSFVNTAMREELNEPLGSEAARKYGLDPSKKQMLRTACLQTHRAVCEDTTYNTQNSGSTVTVAIVRRNQLTMAWLGDSRAVIGREDRKGGKLRAVQLTRDHNCDDMVEAARIRRHGGKVQQYYYSGRFVGPKRIWLKEPMQRTPGLMVSRSIGDEVAHSVGCIADPEMLESDLCHRDKVIIMASDGVWDGISNQKAVDIAWACSTAAEASRAVVDAALEGLRHHGLADNVTAAVIFLPGPATPKPTLSPGKSLQSL